MTVLLWGWSSTTVVWPAQPGRAPRWPSGGMENANVLTLRKLETLASLRLAILLALDHSWISREQPCGPQPRTVLLAGLDQRTGNAKTDGLCLSGQTASMDIHQNVDGAGCLCHSKGRQDRTLPGRKAKIRLEWTPVYYHLTGSRTHVHARCRCLAPSNSTGLGH